MTVWIHVTLFLTDPTYKKPNRQMTFMINPMISREDIKERLKLIERVIRKEGYIIRDMSVKTDEDKEENNDDEED